MLARGSQSLNNTHLVRRSPLGRSSREAHERIPDKRRDGASTANARGGTASRIMANTMSAAPGPSSCSGGSCSGCSMQGQPCDSANANGSAVIASVEAWVGETTHDPSGLPAVDCGSNADATGCSRSTCTREEPKAMCGGRALSLRSPTKNKIRRERISGQDGRSRVGARPRSRSDVSSPAALRQVPISAGL